MMVQIFPHKKVISWSVHLALPNFLCFCKSKFTTPSSRLKPCTLCMVHAHDNVSGNCNRLMPGDMEHLQIGISASHFCNGTKQFCWAKWSDNIAFLPTKGSWNLRKNFFTILFIISKHATSPIWPFMSISCMSALTVTLTLAQTFSSKHYARPPVSDGFLF